MNDDRVTLKFAKSGTTCELPVHNGTLGAPVIDIATLHKDTGHFTLDPGFVATGSAMSSITYLDGDKGELLYRGYPIEQLAEQCTYLEVCHLLLHGELPNRAEKAQFEHTIRHHTMINEGVRKFFDGFRYDAHPMAMLSAAVG